MDSTQIDLLESILVKTRTIIAGVRLGQLQLPTPCPQYTVEALVSHTLSWLNKFAVEAADPGAEIDPAHYVLPTNAASDFHLHADQLVTALRQRPNHSPAGSMLLIEYIVHGWDIAVATAQPVTYSDSEAGAALTVAHAIMRPEYRGPNSVFGYKVTPPPHAGITEQLVAFMGRSPRWTPKT
ncbi:TIGR03086 family protein [Candidatus Saccharibacteria bacterium]|nr:TIGR03086 family protein [Candidatus Saccharibacteria bacterium]